MELIKIFETANNALISRDIDLFAMKVSERTLCGALMLHLHNVILESQFKDYYVDVEYNRNKGGTVKTCIKTVNMGAPFPITINCDLIVHSRGKNIRQDNLIAVEMKKSTRMPAKKNEDRHRLIALTKDSYDDVWSNDGKTLPEHVCGYKLGIYYEICFSKKEIALEYYKQGALFGQKKIPYQL